MSKSALSYATRFVEFNNKCQSPFHAVDEAAKKLLEAGFVRLHENESWQLAPKGRYFVTRNQSTLFAFAVGGAYRPGNGFNMIGAHTDSPCLKLKPKSRVPAAAEFLQVGCQTYGGGLWHTWFDRDLTLAGRVLVATADDKFEHRLVNLFPRPLMRIPNLAIHLNRTVNEDGFRFNKEKHLQPVIATAVADAMNAPAKKSADADADADDKKQPSASLCGDHHSSLLAVLAKALDCDVAAIRDFELSVAEAQPGAIGGVHDEFIFAPRLDNLMSSFTAVEALAAAGNIDSESRVRLVALFDHEEIGSTSAYGASSNMMRSIVRRVTSTIKVDGASLADAGADVHERCMAQSFLVSSDMAHAQHPAHQDKHEPQHAPRLHRGPVIKINANQRYATTAATTLLLKEIARRHNVPVQEFVVRQDMGCGSTIGPIISTNCGVRTIDIGNPQLSMHSIREMCGTDDVEHGIRLMTHFFEDFTQLDAQLKVD